MFLAPRALPIGHRRAWLASGVLPLLLACGPGATIEVNQPDAGLDSGVVADAGLDAARDDRAGLDQDPGSDASGADDSAIEADTGTTSDAASGGDATSGPDSGPPAGQDDDGDGLDDAWEWAAGDENLLDWTRADSDGDGTDDGLEDPDGDGLSNLDELAATRLPRQPSAPAPHPLRRDLLVELDSMVDRGPTDAVLDIATAVFADLPQLNADGSTGVQLHFIRDEQDLTAFNFDGSFEQRNSYLDSHGPGLADDGMTPALPLARMVHVVVATLRTDLSTRGGETVADSGGQVSRSGVFIYNDAIAALHPACGRPVEPVLPDITLEEALGATLAHELGHTLQLGHDTDAVGDINYFNLMSLPPGCLQAQMRMHGDGNSDADLGATEALSAPRFSADAAALMDFERVISRDVADFDQVGGYEM